MESTAVAKLRETLQTSTEPFSLGALSVRVLWGQQQLKDLGGLRNFIEKYPEVFHLENNQVTLANRTPAKPQAAQVNASFSQKTGGPAGDIPPSQQQPPAYPKKRGFGENAAGPDGEDGPEAKALRGMHDGHVQAPSKAPSKFGAANGPPLAKDGGGNNIDGGFGAAGGKGALDGKAGGKGTVGAPDSKGGKGLPDGKGAFDGKGRFDDKGAPDGMGAYVGMMGKGASDGRAMDVESQGKGSPDGKSGNKGGAAKGGGALPDLRSLGEHHGKGEPHGKGGGKDGGGKGDHQAMMGQKGGAGKGGPPDSGFGAFMPPTQAKAGAAVPPPQSKSGAPKVPEDSESPLAPSKAGVPPPTSKTGAQPPLTTAKRPSMAPTAMDVDQGGRDVSATEERAMTPMTTYVPKGGTMPSAHSSKGEPLSFTAPAPDNTAISKQASGPGRGPPPKAKWSEQRSPSPLPVPSKAGSVRPSEGELASHRDDYVEGGESPAPLLAKQSLGAKVAAPPPLPTKGSGRPPWARPDHHDGGKGGFGSEFHSNELQQNTPANAALQQGTLQPEAALMAAGPKAPMGAGAKRPAAPPPPRPQEAAHIDHHNELQHAAQQYNEVQQSGHQLNAQPQVSTPTPTRRPPWMDDSLNDDQLTKLIEGCKTHGIELEVDALAKRMKPMDEHLRGHQRCVELMQAAVAEKWATKTPPLIELVGAAKQGTELDGSETDVAFLLPAGISPEERDTYVGELRETLTAPPQSESFEVSEGLKLYPHATAPITVELKGAQPKVVAHILVSEQPQNLDDRPTTVDGVIQQLCNTSEASRDLARLIKLWAVNHGLTNHHEGYMNGVAWTFLVLFFMQKQKLVPPFAALSYGAAPPATERQQLAALVRSFFEFLAGREGTALRGLSVTHAQEYRPPAGVVLSLEDPAEFLETRQQRNLAESVGQEQWSRIVDEARKAAERLAVRPLRWFHWAEVFDPREVPSDQITRLPSLGQMAAGLVAANATPGKSGGLAPPMAVAQALGTAPVPRPGGKGPAGPMMLGGQPSLAGRGAGGKGAPVGKGFGGRF